MRSLIAISVFCFAVALSVGAAHAEATGVSLPEAVSVAGRELRQNGLGVFKTKVFLKVYAVALYLETPTTEAQAAITADEAKRIVLVMLRDVSREKFVHEVEKGIMRNSGPVMPTLRARLDLLKEKLPALKKGNVLDFTYLPGAGTLIRGQGQELTIPGKDFADALFSVWLGPKPVSDAVKRQLLGG